jgi:hypothetical protein
MYTLLQVLILSGIVSGNGKVNPGHECVDQRHLPCPACLAEEDGYWTRKPHAHAETPAEILENAIWHLLGSVYKFDISPTSTDPETEALWLLYDASQKVLLWEEIFGATA